MPIGPVWLEWLESCLVAGSCSPSSCAASPVVFSLSAAIGLGSLQITQKTSPSFAMQQRSSRCAGIVLAQAKREGLCVPNNRPAPGADRLHYPIYADFYPVLKRRQSALIGPASKDWVRSPSRRAGSRWRVGQAAVRRRPDFVAGFFAADMLAVRATRDRHFRDDKRPLPWRPDGLRSSDRRRTGPV